jgi:hypothetical protein
MTGFKGFGRNRLEYILPKKIQAVQRKEYLFLSQQLTRLYYEVSSDLKI